MDLVKQQLSEKKPSLSESSLVSYASTICNLYKKINNKDYKVHQDEILDFFNNEYNEVLDFLKEKPYSSRKTILASLISFCDNEDAIEEYRKHMKKDIQQYNEFIGTHKLTEKQSENWVNVSEMNEKLKELQKQANFVYSKTSKITPKDIQNVQDYVILSLYLKNDPRRLMDYVNMKFRNFNPETDNYMTTLRFVFNKYKTKKSYGKQSIDISNPLKLVLKKWIKFINENNYDGDHLLFNIEFKPLTPTTLNNRINKIFGKNVGVNIIRHARISEELGPEYKKLQEKAKRYGHDMSMQSDYIKNV